MRCWSGSLSAGFGAILAKRSARWHVFKLILPPRCAAAAAARCRRISAQPNIWHHADNSAKPGDVRPAICASVPLAALHVCGGGSILLQYCFCSVPKQFHHRNINVSNAPHVSTALRTWVSVPPLDPYKDADAKIYPFGRCACSGNTTTPVRAQRRHLQRSQPLFLSLLVSEHVSAKTPLC